MTNVATRILESHLVEGTLDPGTPIAIRIDQTLTQDATGTLVMLELEAMGLDRVKTELSTQYVDHNLIQEDHKNPDDHRFLQAAAPASACGTHAPATASPTRCTSSASARPGARWPVPTATRPAAGAIGMLAIGVRRARRGHGHGR